MHLGHKTWKWLEPLLRDGFNGVYIEVCEFSGIWHSNYANMTIYWDIHDRCQSEYDDFHPDRLNTDFEEEVKSKFKGDKVEVCAIDSGMVEVRVVGPLFQEIEDKYWKEMEMYHDEHISAHRKVAPKTPFFWEEEPGYDKLCADTP